MLKEDMRRVVSARVYQSLAESGVEITAIPQAQLQALINAFADGMIDALSSIEEESLKTESPTGDTHDEETLIWKGRPYLSIGVRYELTSQRLRIFRGLLSTDMDEIELVRIRDTSVTQHLGERALNVGDIEITSNDPSDPMITLHNVTNPLEVRETLRKAVMEERKRRGFQYREEM